MIGTGPVPDFVEPVEAWRVWRVGLRDERVVLESLFVDTVWEPGIPVSAVCAMRSRSRLRPWRRVPNVHTAPDPGCSCGIYGVRTAAAARRYLDRPTFLCRGERVVGRVALWGDVVESELGWRASHAYPLDLLIWAPAAGASLDGIALALDAYGVPVDVVARPSVHGERLARS